MIPRYSRAPMTDIWSSKSRFKIWLDIELYACEAMEKLGTVPKGTSKKVKSKAKINEKRNDTIEKKVTNNRSKIVEKITNNKLLDANDKHQEKIENMNVGTSGVRHATHQCHFDS